MMILTIDNGYDIGEIIYLRTDPDQSPRVITGIKIRANNTVIYMISLGATAETEHYEFEISEEANQSMKIDG